MTADNRFVRKTAKAEWSTECNKISVAVETALGHMTAHEMEKSAPDDGEDEDYAEFEVGGLHHTRPLFGLR